MTRRFAIIGNIQSEEHDGSAAGGAAAIALALAGLGGRVTLRSVVGDDAQGERVLAALRDGDVPVDLIDRIPDAITGLPETTIRKGAMMDIYDLFGHDVLILDFADQPLRRFLIDLPAHTKPDVRMLGTLAHLDRQAPSSDEFEIAMRYDAIVGTPGQYARLTGEVVPSDALSRIEARMPGTHLRAAVLVSNNALHVVSREERQCLPLDSGTRVPMPRAIATVAWGMAERWTWATIAERIAAYN